VNRREIISLNQDNPMQNDIYTTYHPDVIRAKQRFSIVGNSPALLEAIDRALKVAPIDLSVLVTGESGSGKEFFPKIIHYFGARKHKKYIAVNCGAIPEGTIDSELFGHEKGSFTGAISARKGYFEEADGGTIFLDEVAELPLTTQARLLRVLESGEFLKVGSSTVQKTDIRIVAATNVNLHQAVARGKFREDLYYRLSTIIITVPDLHDRGDDILLLARKFAGDFAEKYMTKPISLSEEARTLMLAYRWPGNVRQLKNAIDQLALFQAGESVSRNQLAQVLTIETKGENTPVKPEKNHSYDDERELLWQTLISMQAEIQSLRDMLVPGRHRSEPDNETTALSSVRSIIRYGSDDVGAIGSAAKTLEESERDTIIASLRRNGGNKQATAKELNISQRTLYRKIHEFGLEKL